MRPTPLGLLFCALTAGLALIAVAALAGGALIVGLAAAVLAVWMASLAVRTMRVR
jgi:hypothetical protein